MSLRFQESKWSEAAGLLCPPSGKSGKQRNFPIFPLLISFPGLPFLLSQPCPTIPKQHAPHFHLLVLLCLIPGCLGCKEMLCVQSKRGSSISTKPYYTANGLLLSGGAGAGLGEPNSAPTTLQRSASPSFPVHVGPGKALESPPTGRRWLVIATEGEVGAVMGTSRETSR